MPIIEAKPAKPVSRRTLLLAGGGSAAALVTGGVAATALITDQSPPKAGSPAGVFDIAAASRLLSPTPLHEVSGPQALAFDDTRGHLYTLQGIPGGVRLAGESRPRSSSQRRLHGDMCVSRLSRSGELLAHMYLRGFGHGISLGIEPSGAQVELWVESRADPRTGYGRSVARVPFRDRTVLDSSAPSVRHHSPLPGSHTVHPALDLSGRRVLVSHWTGRQHRYAVYPMDDFLAGRYRPSHTVLDTVRRKGEPLQGCALHGDFIYQLTGNPYTDEDGDNPPSAGGNTYLSAIALRTGKPAGRRRVTVAPTLPFREPEGLAVRLTPRPALCMGFSTKARGRRELSVYGFAG
ncbi:phage baseplate protein [Streptomyces sp. NBC_01465]|uniref:phage baseplate protein n=1 Tax=Streptomyces sp. NBC_01465 TaxID=2903878 RepID=UPI002E2EEE53|nr:signaling protein [Streptomyces sp. NBC_01465]